MQLLLNDEQFAGIDNDNVSGLSSKKAGKRPASTNDTNSEAVRDLWNEEGDDFFGHSVSGAATEKGNDGEIVSAPTRGRKRKTGTSGASRSRKPGGKQSAKKKAETGYDVGSGVDE